MIESNKDDAIFVAIVLFYIIPMAPQLKYCIERQTFGVFTT